MYDCDRLKRNGLFALMLAAGAMLLLPGCPMMGVAPDPAGRGDPCNGACVAGESCVNDVCVADDPEAFKNADGINGGKLADKFWASETGFDQNDPNIDVFSSNGDFFRCKQCHGWDNLGTTGAYISRGPKATRPNVSPLVVQQTVGGFTPQELFDVIKTGEGRSRRDVDADLSTFDPALEAETQEGDWMPDYSQILTDEQIWDLVKYLKEEIVDTAELYDTVTVGTYPTGSRTFENVGQDGNAANGADIFASKCSVCHGAEGTLIIVDKEFSVGSFARAKPYELWHKVKFGQLGTAMDPRVTDINDIQDLFAALADPVAFPDPAAADPCESVTCGTDETCVDGSCVAVGFKNADGINGGKLADKFWASETGFDQNDPNIDVFSSNGDFFRCKQCHGWDNLGTTGAYISRGPKATRPNVSPLVVQQTVGGFTPQELFDVIKTGEGRSRRDVDADLSTFDPALEAETQEGDWMPDYSQILTDEQIWDLVKYLKEEIVDTAELYDTVTVGTYPTGSRTFENVGQDGNAANGADIFASKCSVCHGAEGTLIIVDKEFSVGSFARAKPYELWHKVKFGQLGTAMDPRVTDINDIQDLFAALADAVAFPDPDPAAIP